MASSRKTNHLTPVNYGGSGPQELPDVKSIFLTLGGQKMPRFHFEIVDGYTLADPSGMELPNEQAAEKMAREMAKQVALDVKGDSFKDIVVKTDDGQEIYKTPIRSP
jgi:uncharacterized protein DUF6894